MIARAEVLEQRVLDAAHAGSTLALRLDLHYDRDVVVENATRDTPLTTGYGNYRIF